MPFFLYQVKSNLNKFMEMHYFSRCIYSLELHSQSGQPSLSVLRPSPGQKIWHPWVGGQPIYDNKCLLQAEICFIQVISKRHIKMQSKISHHLYLTNYTWLKQGLSASTIIQASLIIGNWHPLDQFTKFGYQKWAPFIQQIK